MFGLVQNFLKEREDDQKSNTKEREQEQVQEDSDSEQNNSDENSYYLSEDDEDEDEDEEDVMVRDNEDGYEVDGHEDEDEEDESTEDESIDNDEYYEDSDIDSDSSSSDDSRMYDENKDFLEHTQDETLVESDNSNESSSIGNSSDEEEVLNPNDTGDISSSSEEDIMHIVQEAPLEEPTIRHLYHDTPYYFVHKYNPNSLPNMDTLRNTSDDKLEKLEFSLLVYIICNNTYSDPYMAFLMEYDLNAGLYRFPKIQYSIPSNTDKQTHIQSIRNACFELLFPLLHIDPTTVNEEIVQQTRDAFKGFHYDTGTRMGHIGIDVREFIPYLNTKTNAHTLSEHFHQDVYKEDGIPKFSWACVDELLRTTRIYNIQIEPNTTEFLESNPWCYELLDEHSDSTRIPKSLYAFDELNKRSPTKENGQLYLFSDRLPKDVWDSPRFVVYATVESKKEDKMIYATYAQSTYHEF